MISRALLHFLLALSLVLSGLTAVVAETRMAAAGGYCGTDTPQLLLDASGLPLLDGTGTAISAPECPSCYFALAVLTPTPPGASWRAIQLRAAAPYFPSILSQLSVLWGTQARAPPRAA